MEIPPPCSDEPLCQPSQPPDTHTGPELNRSLTCTLSESQLGSNSPPLPPPGQPPRSPTIQSLTCTASESQLGSNSPPLPPPGQPARSLPVHSVLKSTFVDTGGATSFASRNPLKNIQPPRFQVRNSKSDAVKLGQAAEIAARSQKAEDLKIGVDNIIKSRDRDIHELSEQLDVTEQRIQKLVNGETHYKKRREPNMFNALVHKATDEMNTGNIFN